MSGDEFALKALGLVGVAIVTTIVLGGYRLAYGVPERPPEAPAVTSTRPAPIVTWWKNLNRDKAEHRCLKEALLASDRSLYFRLCMEEVGYEVPR